MPVPKRKRSRARRDKRFANKGIKAQALSSCAQCTEPLAPHQACRKCGFYKGAKVLPTKEDRGAKRSEQKAKKEPKQGPIEAEVEQKTE